MYTYCVCVYVWYSMFHVACSCSCTSSYGILSKIGMLAETQKSVPKQIVLFHVPISIKLPPKLILPLSNKRMHVSSSHYSWWIVMSLNRRQLKFNHCRITDTDLKTEPEQFLTSIRCEYFRGFRCVCVFCDRRQLVCKIFVIC